MVDGVEASAAGAGLITTNAQVYASATFAFTTITSGTVTFTPPASSIPNTIPADQKAKALAALHARSLANFAGKAGQQ